MCVRLLCNRKTGIKYGVKVSDVQNIIKYLG